MRLYPDLGHAINADELEFVRGILSPLAMGRDYGSED